MKEILDLCPNCKGEAGKECAVCGGQGYWKGTESVGRYEAIEDPICPICGKRHPPVGLAPEAFDYLKTALESLEDFQVAVQGASVAMGGLSASLSSFKIRVADEWVEIGEVKGVTIDSDRFEREDPPEIEIPEPPKKQTKRERRAEQPWSKEGKRKPWNK